MRTRPSCQLDLTDSFLPTAPANDFLDRLDALVDWQPVQQQLEGMFTATTGRLPQPPLTVFKMLLLEHFYGLSDPQCEALVRDRLSWRKFVGLALGENPISDWDYALGYTYEAVTLVTFWWNTFHATAITPAPAPSKSPPALMCWSGEVFLLPSLKPIATMTLS